MIYIKQFEAFNQINYKIFKKGQNVTIKAFSNEIEVGILSMEYIKNPENGWFWLDGIISEEQFEDITDGKSFVFIENVKSNSPKSGVGTLLIQKAIEEIGKLNTKLIMLVASPSVGVEQISKIKLIKWYSSFGFKLLNSTINAKSVMIKRL